MAKPSPPSAPSSSSSVPVRGPAGDRGGSGGRGAGAGGGAGGGPVVYASASVHLRLPDEVSRRVVAWGRRWIPDEWLFHPSQVDGVGTVAHAGVYLPPCGRVEAPHVTIRGGLREADFEAIKRDLDAVAQPYLLQFGRVAIWNSGYYGVVVVNVAATKPMNDMFRQLGRHPTASTSDKGRNNLKPHATIAYLRKDKVDALLHALQAAKMKAKTKSTKQQSTNNINNGTGKAKEMADAAPSPARGKKKTTKKQQQRMDSRGGKLDRRRQPVGGETRPSTQQEEMKKEEEEKDDAKEREDAEAEVREEAKEAERYAPWKKNASEGIEFLLNETCYADQFEFGWRDGTATAIHISHRED